MKPILETSKIGESCSNIFNQTVYISQASIKNSSKANATKTHKAKSSKASSGAISTNETLTMISARLSQNVSRAGRVSGRPLNDLSTSILNITQDEGTRAIHTTRTSATHTPKGSANGNYMQGTKASKSKQIFR